MGNSCCFNDRNLPINDKNNLLIINDGIQMKTTEHKVKQLESTIQELEKKLLESNKRNESLTQERDTLELKMNSVIAAYNIIVKELTTKLEAYTSEKLIEEIDLNPLDDFERLSPNLSSFKEPGEEQSVYQIAVPLAYVSQLNEGIKVHNFNIEKMKNYQDAIYVALVGRPGTNNAFLSQFFGNNESMPSEVKSSLDITFKIWTNPFIKTRATVLVETPSFQTLLRENDTQLETYHKDKFLFQFADELASLVIIVMSKVTLEDEEFLRMVAQKSSKDAKIVVVHNFTGVGNSVELEERIRIDLTEPFKAKRELIAIKNKQVTVYVQQDLDKKIVHLFLTNGNMIHKFNKINENTSDYIESLIENDTKVLSFGKYGPISRLMDYIERNIGEFVPGDEKEKVDCSFDENTGMLVAHQHSRVETKKMSDIHSKTTRTTLHEDDYERPQMKIMNGDQDIQLSFEIANLNTNNLKIEIDQVDQNKYKIKLESERVTHQVDSEDEKEDETILRRSVSTKLVAINQIFESARPLMVEKIGRKYDEKTLVILIPFSKEDKGDGNWDVISQ